LALTLAATFEKLIGEVPAVGFRGYDGSWLDRPEAVGVVELRSPRALRYLATAPGELGLARAYVTGAIEIHGDLHATLHRLLAHRGDPWRTLLPQTQRWMLHRPPLPPEELPSRARRGLRVHTRDRDSRAIAHHYDLSNRFYELILGRSMVYSCAVFPNSASSLEDAQCEKLDLICRKLDLTPGERLLDVGAGWGSLVLHAAEHYGVRALGVTLSRKQAEWAQRAIAAAGLSHRAEVRPLDWRDLGASRFDAISSVGTMEHIGSRELGSHFAAMARHLPAEGRMLNHTITRPNGRARARVGPFIDRYVFPDGELEGPASVIGAMHDHGLEVRHEENIREHYAMTLREWSRNLDGHWNGVVREVGERRARVWRLYFAISRVGFDLNRIQVHQILGARVGADGRSGMALRPEWGAAERRAVHGAELRRERLTV
jgi:cyclopropane-fatty-acyl-phospholipid synthase